MPKPARLGSGILPGIGPLLRSLKQTSHQDGRNISIKPETKYNGQLMEEHALSLCSEKQCLHEAVSSEPAFGA